jgi:hypothetical protein
VNQARAAFKNQSFVPLALDIIRKSGTVQECRTPLTPIGKPAARIGAIPMKEVQYWGFGRNCWREED